MRVASNRRSRSRDLAIETRLAAGSAAAILRLGRGWAFLRAYMPLMDCTRAIAVRVAAYVDAALRSPLRPADVMSSSSSSPRQDPPRPIHPTTQRMSLLADVGIVVDGREDELFDAVELDLVGTVLPRGRVVR